MTDDRAFYEKAYTTERWRKGGTAESRFAKVWYQAFLDQIRDPARESRIAPVPAGEFVRDHIQDSRMVLIEGQGHCPHLSAPEQTTAALVVQLGT